MSIKTKISATLLTIFGLVLLVILFIIEIISNNLYNIYPNVTSIIDNSCTNALLNLSNPYSYINKVTKPFLIELVKNATNQQ